MPNTQDSTALTTAIEENTMPNITDDTHVISASFTFNNGTDGGDLAVNGWTLEETVDDILRFYNNSGFTAEKFAVTNRDVADDGTMTVAIEGREHYADTSGKPTEGSHTITATITAVPRD